MQIKSDNIEFINKKLDILKEILILIIINYLK
jgi:hypothetical protein